jgi:hypothetical protein
MPTHRFFDNSVDIWQGRTIFKIWETICAYQCRFLLGLSSGLLDIMPLPGTMLAQSKLSNDAINDIIFLYLRFAYRICTPR